MNNGAASYLEWRECLLAIRSRIDELTKGVDPAPWHVASTAVLPGDNETPNVRQMAVYARANSTFFRAMLVGSLQGWFVDGGERWAIPGWVWADQGGDWRALIEGNDFVHPLAPPEFRRWAWLTVLVEQDAFEVWLAGAELKDQSDFPQLPTAYDEGSRPPLVTHQTPPARPNVSLAHAVSWLAFKISLDAKTLASALSGGVLGENRGDAQRRLEEAADRLLTAGTGGLPFIGKFVEAGGDYGAPLTELIPRERLEDFRQFDLCFDGLRYGEGVHQHWSDPGMVTFERAFPATTRRYVDVKVERQALMALRADAGRATELTLSDRATRVAAVARTGRTPGSGSYALVDAPLLAEMKRLIGSRKALSANAAAHCVAERAIGGGTIESKAARLAKAYRVMERNREE